ncbi:MAG: tripartite tricarboxylate transporter TctB family protein [Betaproteobacteria bacterium]
MDTAASTTAEDDEPSARADLVASALWIAFGAAVALGAWRMDRLERLNINPYEAPGLVPGLLGGLIVLLGLALAMRSVRRRALQPASALATGTPAAPAASPQALRHMAAVFGLTLCYALALVGTGLPFWLATFAFITVFVGLLDRERQARLGRSAPAQWVRATVYGASWSALVTLSFQHIFLVRLP